MLNPELPLKSRMQREDANSPPEGEFIVLINVETPSEGGTGPKYHGIWTTIKNKSHMCIVFCER